MGAIMAKEKKRYKLDTEIGVELYTIIRGYAKVQKITMGSLVRQVLSDSFRSELVNVCKGEMYEPKIVQKEWK